MRIRSIAGHPVEQHSSPNIGGDMSGHEGLALHIAEGSYRGTISWQLNPDQKYGDGTRVMTSSTWIVGRQPGEVAQMVDTETIAWCQRSGSRTWHSVELAGFAPAAPTAWQIEACAQLLAWEHRTHGVPLQVADHPGERGLGHHSMDREWLGEQWGHEACPGAGVIGAKQQIVRRATEIIVEGDGMSVYDKWPAKWGVDPDGVERSPAQWMRDVDHALIHGQPAWGTNAPLPGVPTPWIVSMLEAIAKTAGVDQAELDAIAAAAAAGAERGVAAGADELAAAIVAELPAGPMLSRADVEAAVATVLGTARITVPADGPET